MTEKITTLLRNMEYDLDISLFEKTETHYRYFLELHTRAQYIKMFKIPNHLHEYLDIRGSELIDASGDYTKWLLEVPIQ